MPLTLTFTGTTLTIAGSDAGSVNTIYTRTVDATTWTASGSRSGNGTVTLSLADGYYWAYCHATLVSAAPALSNVAGIIGVTAEDESVYEQLANEAMATIQAFAAAGLDGIGADDVSVGWSLDDSGIEFPHIFIHPPPGASETPNGGTNLRDDWIKPLQISVVDRAPEQLDTNFGQVNLNRQRLIRLFNNKTMSGVAELNRVVIQPLAIVTFLKDKYDYQISAFTLNNWTREPRTP